MGYPYYCCMYDNYVACSSDYGVCFLEITNKEAFWFIKLTLMESTLKTCLLFFVRHGERLDEVSSVKP
jgi:hypothetical protein